MKTKCRKVVTLSCIRMSFTIHRRNHRAGCDKRNHQTEGDEDSEIPVDLMHSATPGNLASEHNRQRHWRYTYDGRDTSYLVRAL